MIAPSACVIRRGRSNTGSASLPALRSQNGVAAAGKWPLMTRELIHELPATRSRAPSRSQSQPHRAVRPHRPPGPQPRTRLPST